MIHIALAALVAFPVPDILLPGTKSVTHELVLEATPAAEGWRFVAAPTAGFGVAEVSVGEPFSFSSKYGTRLWAFRPEQEVPLSWKHGHSEGFEGHPVGALPAEIAAVSSSDPLSRVLTTLRVASIDEEVIHLERVGEERWDAEGKTVSTRSGTILFLIVLAAFGLLGLVFLVRSKRVRSEAPAA